MLPRGHWLCGMQTGLSRRCALRPAGHAKRPPVATPMRRRALAPTSVPRSFATSSAGTGERWAGTACGKPAALPPSSVSVQAARDTPVPGTPTPNPTLHPPLPHPTPCAAACPPTAWSSWPRCARSRCTAAARPWWRASRWTTRTRRVGGGVWGWGHTGQGRAGRKAGDGGHIEAQT